MEFASQRASKGKNHPATRMEQVSKRFIAAHCGLRGIHCV
jgi:hypothetical protein